MWFLAGHHVTPKPLPGLLGQIGSVTECQSPPPAETGGNPRAARAGTPIQDRKKSTMCFHSERT